jgi:hypothetical protein
MDTATDTGVDVLGSSFPFFIPPLTQARIFRAVTRA